MSASDLSCCQIWVLPNAKTVHPLPVNDSPTTVDSIFASVGGRALPLSSFSAIVLPLKPKACWGSDAGAAGKGRTVVDVDDGGVAGVTTGASAGVLAKAALFRSKQASLAGESAIERQASRSATGSSAKPGVEQTRQTNSSVILK
jgi:hypothetical protein